MTMFQDYSRYDQVILALYARLIEVYGNDAIEHVFDKQLLDDLGEELQIKNIPDILYSYRSGRRPFPDVMQRAGNWVIKGIGRGRYVLIRLQVPTELLLPYDLEAIAIPDATPEIVLKYAKGDEQSVLVQVRYNRLIDIFTSLTAYHMQSHVRSYVDELGQVEIDDLYFAVNTEGEWFCIPVGAKQSGPTEQLGRVQISSMVAYAYQEFPELTVRPIGIKLMEDGSIFLAEFTSTDDSAQTKARSYKRYRLVEDKH